jgi:hypothetical protein
MVCLGYMARTIRTLRSESKGYLLFIVCDNGFSISLAYQYLAVTVLTVQRVPCNMVNYARFVVMPRKLHLVTYFSSVDA